MSGFVVKMCAHLSIQPRNHQSLPMERPAAISAIRTACNTLAAGVTSIHPLLPALADEPTKAEIVKALFELTKNIEVVKKQAMRLEKRDDSALL